MSREFLFAEIRNNFEMAARIIADVYGGENTELDEIDKEISQVIARRYPYPARTVYSVYKACGRNIGNTLIKLKVMVAKGE